MTSIDGYNAALDLSCSGLPGASSCSFAPGQVAPPVNGTANSTLTIQIDAGVADGSYPVTVTATVPDKLGAEPAVTCRYDLSGIPQRRQRRFDYSCACTTYAISTVRHNRVQRGKGSYQCRQCRQSLVFTG